MEEQNLVKVRLKFKEGADLPAAETMWAEPVEAHDGGGTYRLMNTSFMVPLAAGDVVRAEIDGWGGLQVVNAVEPCDRVMTVVEFPEADDAKVKAIADSWTKGTDGWTEGGNRMLFTIWAEGMPLPAVSTILDAAIGSLEGWEWHAAAGPEHRTEADLGDVDFELDRDGPEPFETDYWAPDDPEWAARGVTDPDMLSFIQRLASEDQRVARTLKNGKHDNVMTYIERITSDDPRTLPPLDGPLLDEA